MQSHRCELLLDAVLARSRLHDTVRVYSSIEECCRRFVFSSIVHFEYEAQCFVAMIAGLLQEATKKGNGPGFGVVGLFHEDGVF